MPSTKPKENAIASEGGSSVIVVGGGLAGIAAAWKLSEKGFYVTLLDAKKRLGGRAGSFQTPDGESIDYCQHVGMGCCSRLIEMIDWLEQTSQWDIHRTLHFFGPDGHHMPLGALPLPAPVHIAHWLWKWPGLTMRDRIAIGWGMHRIRRINPEDIQWDSVPAIQWFQTQRQTAGAIDRFWSTIVVSALGELPERVSIAPVAKVIQDGFLNSRSAFHLLVPRQPLDQLFNNEAIKKLTQSGVSVRLGCRVRELRTEKEGASVILTSGEEVSASHVISAVPWHQVGRLQVRSASHSDTTGNQELLYSEANRLVSSPITGIHTWWSDSWLDTPHAVLVGRLCQWVFPKNEHKVTPHNTEHNNASHYYQIVISASRNLLNLNSQALEREEYRKAIEETLVQDLAEVFPKLHSAKLLRFQIVTDPHSVFSVSVGTQQIRPKTRTKHPRVWLAGDWTRTGWPATMEGAIRSGISAAEAIDGYRSKTP